MTKLTYSDLHLHSEFSLKDGMIRVAHAKDPKHIKEAIILNAERRNTGAVTMTDHGNMYGHAILASVCKTFGLKHIPACEFYIAPKSRFERDNTNRYSHICGWAKNKQGYANMCTLQKLSYTEGFYYQPRIDKELLDKYGDGIIWSDACAGGTLGSLIMNGKHDEAYSEFLWYLDRFKDDFCIEYQNHHMSADDEINMVKIPWADKHGVCVIATTDSHFNTKEDEDAHRALLCIQWGKYFDDPTFEGFPGDGYWLMSEEELVQRFPYEYLNNTQFIVDKIEGGIIQFGNVQPPSFTVPESFKGGNIICNSNL